MCRDNNKFQIQHCKEMSNKRKQTNIMAIYLMAETIKNPFYPYDSTITIYGKSFRFSSSELTRLPVLVVKTFAWNVR